MFTRTTDAQHCVGHYSRHPFKVWSVCKLSRFLGILGCIPTCIYLDVLACSYLFVHKVGLET